MRPSINGVAVLTLALAIILPCFGCRQHDRYLIELRDAQTHAPIADAQIVTRYNMFDELMMRPFHWGALKNHKVRTNDDGRAWAKVEPNYNWWLAIYAPGRPLHSIYFNADGSLNHSLGVFEVHDQWIRARLFGKDDVGSVEVSMTRKEDLP